MSDLRRWMLFVDGENLALRASEYVAGKGYQIVPTEYSHPGSFIWPPQLLNEYRNNFRHSVGRLQIEFEPIQSHYCTSVNGGSQAVGDVTAKLWNLGFTPHVFHKVKGTKSKGVDITLTTLLLGHAYRDNYDVAVLVTGDADFTPAIREVRREGKAVHLCAFESVGFRPDFRFECDTFDNLEQFGSLFLRLAQPKPKDAPSTSE